MADKVVLRMEPRVGILPMGQVRMVSAFGGILLTGEVRAVSSDKLTGNRGEGKGRAKVSSRGIGRACAICGLVLAIGVTLYELTWLRRSGVAWAMACLGAAVALVAVSQLIPWKSQLGDDVPSMRLKLSRNAVVAVGAVLAVMLLGALLVGVLTAEPASVVHAPEQTHDGVRLFDMRMRRGTRQGQAWINGRIENQTDRLLYRVTFKVRIYDGRGQLIDSSYAAAKPDGVTPPDDVSSFHTNLAPAVWFPEGRWRWDWEYGGASFWPERERTVEELEDIIDGKRVPR